jgi:hypothetical protein
MTPDILLNQNGKEQFPLSTILFANIMMLFWLGLGTITVWFFCVSYLPSYAVLVTVVYFFIAFSLVYLVLRKIVCTNCYYYDKWCALGWGKLSAVFFKQGNIEHFNDVGPKLAPLVYGMLTLVPFILIILSLLRVIDYYRIGVLILLFLSSAYSAGLGRKNSCASCKMNTYCKGTVVKKMKE